MLQKNMHGKPAMLMAWMRKDAEGGDAEENVRRILGIPSHLRVLNIVAVGHKGMERKTFNEERLLWEKVHIYSPMLPCF